MCLDKIKSHNILKSQFLFLLQQSATLLLTQCTLVKQVQKN